MRSLYMHGSALWSSFLESMYQEIRWADEVDTHSQSAVVDGVFPPGQCCLPVSFQSENTAVFPDLLNKQEPLSPKLGPLLPAISIHVL